MAVEIIKTVKPSGGDYTSLSAWEAAQGGVDLTALDEIHTAECYAMSDTTPCTINGGVTDATRYFKVTVPASERHDGKWNATKYRMEPTDASALTISENFIRIDGIQVGIIAPTANRSDIGFSFNDSVSDIRIENTIVKGAGAYSEGLGVATSGVGNLKLSNVLLYNCLRSFFGGIRYGGAAGMTCYVYNCSIIDCYYGVSGSGGTVIVKNTLASGASNSCFSGTLDSVSDYNAASDATSTGGANDRTNQTFTFVDAANDDYHLAATDAGARDFGVDLSADANYPITTDIDGSTRTGTWDIGADEYIAGGGGSALLKVYNETVNCTSGNGRLMAMMRASNQTQQVTEGTQRRGGLLRVLGDTLSITAAAIRASALVRAIGEAVSLTGGVLRRMVMSRRINDAVGISEGALKSISTLLVKVISSTVQATEGVARRLFLSRYAGEDLAVTEGVARRGLLRRVLNGSTAITEGVLKASSLVRTLGETVSLAGAAIKRSSLVRLAASTVQAVESTSTVRGFVRVVSETMSVAEGVVRGAVAALGTLSDNLSVVFVTLRRGILSRSHKRGVKS